MYLKGHAVFLSTAEGIKMHMYSLLFISCQEQYKNAYHLLLIYDGGQRGAREEPCSLIYGWIMKKETSGCKSTAETWLDLYLQHYK